MKDKAFELLSWTTRKLRGSGLKRLLGVEEVYNFIYKALEPKDGIRLVDVGGFEMFVDIRDIGGVSPNLMKKKGYHPFMTKILEETIEPGMTCIDVGANIGYFSMILSELVSPHGSVFAFEPEPKNFNVLSKNALQINAKRPFSCIPEQLAVGNQVGELPLYTTGYNFGGHSLHMESEESISVKVTTLDSYFNDFPINFVKIDVEGYEPEVIAGMAGVINKNPNLIIILEHMPGLIDSQHLQSLEDRGFKLSKLDEVRKEIVPIIASDIVKTDLVEGVAFNILARRPI